MQSKGKADKHSQICNLVRHIFIRRKAGGKEYVIPLSEFSAPWPRMPAKEKWTQAVITEIQHESLPKPINAWMTAASIEDGRLLRSISKSGKVNGDTLSDWAVWSVVEQSSKQIRIEHFGAHDLRRTCAKLCWKNGGDIEQIKFQLGDSSIQTTERYLVNSARQEYEMERIESGADIETSLSPWRVRRRLHTDLQI